MLIVVGVLVTCFLENMEDLLIFMPDVSSSSSKHHGVYEMNEELKLVSDHDDRGALPMGKSPAEVLRQQDEKLTNFNAPLFFLLPETGSLALFDVDFSFKSTPEKLKNTLKEHLVYVRNDEIVSAKDDFRQNSHRINSDTTHWYLYHCALKRKYVGTGRKRGELVVWMCLLSAHVTAFRSTQARGTI